MPQKIWEKETGKIPAGISEKILKRMPAETENRMTAGTVMKPEKSPAQTHKKAAAPNVPPAKRTRQSPKISAKGNIKRPDSLWLNLVFAVRNDVAFAEKKRNAPQSGKTH